jgi:L-aspartate oxidase
VNHEAPVVIVGGGVAGLSTALACAPRPVLLLSRGRGSDGSASLLAQGGIAAALAPEDTPQSHLVDTLAAGAYHNDVSAAR